MSAIIDAMHAFRRQLTAGELQARAVMVRRWLQVEAALQGDVIATIERIAQMRQQGVTVRAWRVMELDRYQSLLRQSRTQITRYVDNVAGPVTATRQLQLIDLGQQHALTAHSVLGVRAQFGRLPREVIENLAGVAGDGTPLNDLLRRSYGADEADAILERMIVGVARGQNPRVIARDVLRHGYSQSLTRMMATMRTEPLRAYRHSSIETYRHNRVVIGYRRLASLDDRTCLGCLIEDGAFLGLDTDFEAHPLCLPAGAVVHSPTLEATTHRWYEGHIVNIRTAAGNELAVTPNHPILTDKGWIAAHLIQPGDNVISTSDAQGMLNFVDPDNQHEPALIEQIVHSRLGASGMVPVTMPQSPVDFHGDGWNGDVNIVFTDSFLQGGIDTALLQPFGNEQFVIRGMRGGFFSALCYFHQRAMPAFRSANSLMGSLGVASVFFGGAFGHHETVGLGLSTDFYGGRFENYSDDAARASIMFGDSILGFSGQIPFNNFIVGNAVAGAHRSAAFRSGDTSSFGFASPETARNEDVFERPVTDSVLPAKVLGCRSSDVFLDSVLDVSVRAFSGHVYNFQTEKGWYVANNIITHNCRCTATPVLGDEEPDWELGEDWFLRQEETTQRRMMGPKKHQAWRDGKFELRSIVKRVEDSTWGTSIVEAPLRELVN